MNTKKPTRLVDLVGVWVKPESIWITLYCALALDCDTPILEALVYTTYAFAGVKPTNTIRLVRQLQFHLCRFLRSDKKEWHFPTETGPGEMTVSSRRTSKFFQLWVNSKHESDQTLAITALCKDEPVFSYELHAEPFLTFYDNASDTPQLIRAYQFSAMLANLKNDLRQVFK